jgi:hypothetical protein
VTRGGALAAPLLASLLALATRAGAQEAPLLDQWLETYQASRKVSWEHLVVRPTPGAAGYTLRREVWIPTAEGRVHVEEIAEVDSSCLLRGLERVERWPDGGEVRQRIAATAEGVEAALEPRGESPQRLKAPGPLLAWRLLGLQHSQAPLRAGERHAYLRELPGPVARPARVKLTPEPSGGLRLEAAPLRIHFDGQGRIKRIDHLEQIATVSLASTQADAEDPTHSRATPRGLGPRGELPFPLHGFTLHPPGPDWLLTRRALADGLSLGLAHPSGTRIRIMHVPQLTPGRDRPTCERLAAELVASPPAPRLALSDPRLATHGTGLAIVFRWREGGRALPPSEGEAMLLRGREGGLLVLGSAPAGAEPPQRALGAIRVLPTPLETITLTQLGLRFAIPRRWEELEPGDYASPDRLARFTVERVEIPILTKPSAYQRQLLGNLSRLVADARTDDRPGELAGRPCRRVTIRGSVRGQEGGPSARIQCAIFVEEQVLTAVTAVAIGSGRASAELDDVWASVQWRLEGERRSGR